MKNKYSDLKDDLRSILSRFRWELLLSDLLKGTVFLAAYVLLYLFVYYCFISFFPVFRRRDFSRCLFLIPAGISFHGFL